LTNLSKAVDFVLDNAAKSGKPLAIIIAGHNGSGKSTMWRKTLSIQLQMPFPLLSLSGWTLLAPLL
jgi:ABC-type Mn2+/Zn2+ transport system ATPase subunit